MKYCPHCGKPTAYEQGPCPHCRKDLGGGTAPSSSTTTSTSASGSAKETSSKGTAASDPMAFYGGQELDATQGEGGEPGAPLELAVDTVAERMGPEQKKVDAKTRAAEDRKRAEETARQEQLRQDAARLAAYGAHPGGWKGSVGYLFGVRRRRGALAVELRGAAEELEARRRDLAKDFTVIGRRRLAEPEAGRKYPEEVEAIRQSEKQLEVLQSDLGVQERDKEEKFAYFDEETMRLQAEVEKLRIEELAIGKEADVRGGEHKRVRMRSQRYEIEIRNLRQLMAPKAGKGAAPVDPATFENLRTQLADAEAKKSADEEVVAAARAAVEEVDRKRALVRSGMTELLGKITLMSKKKEQLLLTVQRKSSETGRRAEVVNDELTDWIARLGRACHDADDLPPTLAGTKGKLAEKIAAVGEAERKVELHRLARECYDHVAYQRGLLVVAAVGLGAFLLLVTGISLAFLL